MSSIDLYKQFITRFNTFFHMMWGKDWYEYMIPEKVNQMFIRVMYPHFLLQRTKAELEKRVEQGIIP